MIASSLPAGPPADDESDEIDDEDDDCIRIIDFQGVRSVCKETNTVYIRSTVYERFD